MNSYEAFAAFLVLAYTVSHVVRLAFYWPQMRSLWLSTNAAAIAVPTWAFWSFHSYLTVLYLVFVSHDYWLATLFFISGACTTWIAVVAYIKQKKAKVLAS